MSLGNLVCLPFLTHTRLTYHRTWETGLGEAARVATVSPDFFALPDSLGFWPDFRLLLLRWKSNHFFPTGIL